MHFQPGMAKLLWCVRDSILDGLVDIRRGSPTFGQWEAFELSDENRYELFCRDGFAHGCCVLSDVADVVYKTSAYYDASAEAGFAYNGPEVAIEWPCVAVLTPPPRDASAPLLSEIALTSVRLHGPRASRAGAVRHA